MTDTATTTLASFLEARIAEGEAVARDVILVRDAGRDGQNAARAQFGLPPISNDTEADWYHIAYKHLCANPARVLAECAAQRRVVEQYLVECDRGPAGDRLDFQARHSGILDAYQVALRALAQPYADHPEFREEWR